MCDGVPRIDAWGCHRGRLVEALSICGAVFLEAGPPDVWIPNPEFGKWNSLWEEAVNYWPDFSNHYAVRQRLLNFNRAEDLARTLRGDAKSHSPDLRYNFGVTCANALYRTEEEWGSLWWVAENFRATLGAATWLVRQELQHLAEHSRHNTLGAKLWNGWGESWTGSRLRHSVYPANGSCTEHTDYGVLTLQQSTSAGLEAFISGTWRQLHAPAGCAVAFAGDMLELLTNGCVPALRHRVCLETAVAVEQPPYSATGKGVVRQSHIIFIQPDKRTVVEPLQVYRRNDGTDMASVKYGDWHNVKASLAFTRS